MIGGAGRKLGTQEERKRAEAVQCLEKVAGGATRNEPRGWAADILNQIRQQRQEQCNEDMEKPWNNNRKERKIVLKSDRNETREFGLYVFLAIPIESSPRWVPGN